MHVCACVVHVWVCVPLGAVAYSSSSLVPIVRMRQCLSSGYCSLLRMLDGNFARAGRGGERDDVAETETEAEEEYEGGGAENSSDIDRPASLRQEDDGRFP